MRAAPPAYQQQAGRRCAECRGCTSARRYAQTGGDVNVDAFQARGRTLKIAVIEGQHNRFTGTRAEDTRQTRLHSLVQCTTPFQRKQRVGLGFVCMKILSVSDVIQVSHDVSPQISKVVFVDVVFIEDDALRQQDDAVVFSFVLIALHTVG